jgi:high-affinity iron transporter
MFSKACSLVVLLFLLFTVAHAENNSPMIINATVTATDIKLSPDTIAENTPFVIHVINKAGVPIELENSDTSVEIYADMDKTFRVGLSAGSYIFFNDFNPHSKTAALVVKKSLNLTDKTNSRVDGITTTDSLASSRIENSAILFIVWRESVEALLVVGIVYGWLKQTREGFRTGILFLGLGVIIGILCAILLSLVLVKIGGNLTTDATSYFQATMTFIAAFMIVYMVKWMRENAQKLKSGMRNTLQKNAFHKWQNISITTVVAVAVAREASEAAIFIYALGFERSHDTSITMIGILAAGIALAILTIYLLQLGSKFFSWRFFFKITEILLLLLGGGLLLNGVDQLIAAGFLTPLFTKIWDTSFIIGNGGLFAPLLTSFTGYRATPSLMDVLVYSMYWISIYYLLKIKKTHAK